MRFFPTATTRSPLIEAFSIVALVGPTSSVVVILPVVTSTAATVYELLVPEKRNPLTTTQRPVAELAFSEPSGRPAWKTLPSWAAVATGDKAAGSDLVRSMAARAGATVTEVEGSHVIMLSQPQAVTDVILQAIRAVG